MAQERAALITGGSSGIGLAVARALGEDGFGVTIAARRPDKLEGAAAGTLRVGHADKIVKGPARSCAPAKNQEKWGVRRANQLLSR